MVPGPDSPAAPNGASPEAGADPCSGEGASSPPPAGPGAVSPAGPVVPSEPGLSAWEDEEAGPSAAGADSPVEAPSPSPVGAGAASVPVDWDSPEASGAGASWVLDPLEDSGCEEPAEEDSASAGVDSGVPAVPDSGAPGGVASSEVAGEGSEDAGVDSAEPASWALATPTGSSASHAIAASSAAQSHALERPFLEEPAAFLIIPASP